MSQASVKCCSLVLELVCRSGIPRLLALQVFELLGSKGCGCNLQVLRPWWQPVIAFDQQLDTVGPGDPTILSNIFATRACRFSDHLLMPLSASAPSAISWQCTPEQLPRSSICCLSPDPYNRKWGRKEHLTESLLLMRRSTGECLPGRSSLLMELNLGCWA